MNTRYAFIHFPEFCHQQTKIIHKMPALVLVKEAHKALYVSGLSNYEYKLGIRLNMPLANAKAIVPNIAYYHHEDKYFNQAFLSLGYAAMRFSPQVAIDDDYGLLINISGCAHLFGGEHNLLMAIEASFSERGFYIKKAIAKNPLLAKALAYFSNATIDDGNNNHLKPLPIEALFTEQTIIDALHDLGIATIGALLPLQKKRLAQRFGVKFIQRLDQLSGNIQIPVTYLEEKPQFIVSEHFLSPIRTHEHFIEEAQLLIEKALSQLDKHYLSLLCMTILLKDSFKQISKLTIASTYANNERKHWGELLSLKTHDLRFNDGIDGIKLVLTHYEKNQYRQSAFDKSSNSDTKKRSIITDKLKSRLGDKAIFHLRVTEKHMPELAVSRDYSLMAREEQKLLLPPRPLRLLKTPIPIKVIALLPDNPPAKILWNQRAINVLHASGPERIEHEWWTGINEPYRDYFYLEDERGQRLWVYSSGEPKLWFIHGIFA